MDEQEAARGIARWLSGENVAALLTGMILGAQACIGLLLPFAIRRSLGEEKVVPVDRAVRPPFYRAAAIACIVAGLFCWYRVDIVWLVASGLLYIYLGYVVRPALEAYRDAWAGGEEAAEMPYRLAHRRNFGMQTLICFILLVVFLRLVG